MTNARWKCPVVGLTGGIGAGKSAVAGMLKDLGATIVDADGIVHQVLDWPDVSGQIRAVFGEGVFEGSQVSRSALADAAFRDAESVAKLNAIVHPAVIEETRRIIAAAGRDSACRAIVLDAPLLFETGLDGLCGRTVFVDAAEDARLERLASSRGWGRDELARREKFQDSLIEKEKRADYTVDNNGPLGDTISQVAAIWQKITDD